MRARFELAATLAGLAAAQVRAPREKPNIIMFFVDDLGYGDVGFNGHPTAETPNIDALAYGGLKMTQWYSGCPVCSGSRAALMTGRQNLRTGVPGVLPNSAPTGLPLNETTLAEQLKTVGYATAAVGKWHLGQRRVYLPHNRGFDQYLGIPFSVDMGQGRASACGSAEPGVSCKEAVTDGDWGEQQYRDMGYLGDAELGGDRDPGELWTPLVFQEKGMTHVLEQPVDFTFLAEKYNRFALDFIKSNAAHPFFLYMPFSHVHVTATNMPGLQYAGCDFKNTSRRGPFGDAFAEVDWMVGNVAQAVREAGIEENTLMLFTSDNGPWMVKGLSAGSTGLFTGRYSGYWNTGKGSTWEGGIRMPAWAYWKGQIKPFSRTSEVVSSMDVFPTVSHLAGASLPADRAYDGKDMSEVLFQADGRSKHDFLFFYGSCHGKNNIRPTAVRHGKWKAHWCTGPGLDGCEGCRVIQHDPPLLFNVEKDPSEAEPVITSSDEGKAAVEAIQAAYKAEVASFTTQELIPEPDEKGEGPGRYAVCCDRAQMCKCNGDLTGEQTVLTV